MELFSLFSAEDTPALHVAQLTQYISELFNIDLLLQNVAVEGEISNFVRARSGHLYFTLKDEQAQLKCVMWRSSAERVRVAIADGMTVVVRGRVGVYDAGGNYQLYAEQIRPLGQGPLAQQFEHLKARLAAEGLFDPATKKSLPPYPRKIGIVTSASAAALRDILHVLSRRYPLAHVLIAPTLVQGAEAPPGIVQAIEWLDGRDDVDVIIVARGGGSLEDLWAFNDERVARAIFSAEKPIISGIGHEIDFTIADFVADVRAPTPSAAAELVSPDISELIPALQGVAQQLQRTILGRIVSYQREVAGWQRALHMLDPRRRVQNSTQKLDHLALRLDHAWQRQRESAETRLTLYQTKLALLNPLALLEKGYTLVRRSDGTLVRAKEGVQAAEMLHLQFADGTLVVTVVS